MRRPTHFKSDIHRISPSKLKKMKPNTASSPFGPSFVDYIAGSRDDLIAALDATMANIPYASG